MRLSLTFRAKLVASHVAVVLLGVAVASLVLDRTVGAEFVERAEKRLDEQAMAAAGWVDAGRHHDTLTARLARVMDARVTVTDHAGVVLGDSEYPDATLPDQRGEPEVAAALADGLGRAVRVDEAGVLTHYVAVRTGAGKVIRLGVPARRVLGVLGEVREKLLVAAALALLAAIALGFFAARVGARPLRAMTGAAQRIARGDYAIAPAVTSRDEFGTLARSLASLASQLDRLATMRRDFVANITHEIRTPVTAIHGYAETLLDRPVDEATRREFLAIMQEHARRISRLVDDLLLLAEAESLREERMAREPVPLSPVVAEAVAAVRGFAGADLIVDVEVAKDLRVTGDPRGVEQIVGNLVDNAARHGGDPGRIRIAARREGRAWIALAVEDSGPGIAEEHRGRIFERFYRGAKERSREPGGSGLGLAIVKHWVEAMGGTVQVEAGEGGAGARFLVRLPSGGALSEAPGPAAPKLSQSASRSPSGTTKP